MITLEKAKPGEEKECYRMLDEGRNFQHSLGFYQWDETYPTFEIVENDVKEGIGWAVKSDGEIAAYMAIKWDGEPIYDKIDGAWGSEGPFLAVHRIAIGDKFRGTGISGKIFGLIEELGLSRGYHTIRIDTDFPNLVMQHVLEKSGFTRRGIVFYSEAEGNRIAYDKIF